MILVTGGAGYIGSHVNKALALAGIETVVIDNLSSGHRELVKWGKLEVGDLGDTTFLNSVFEKYPIDGVIHFAAFKSVGESVTNPEKYYYNNVVNTLHLLKTMREHEVKKIVFSSSAATFGNPEYNPIDEKHPQNPINPYGFTKLVMEKMLADYEKAYGFRYAALRYFNAAGADSEGDIGEWPGSSANLIPLVLDVAAGSRESVSIFGTDWPTDDGTCIRDYVHVTDLAQAHLKALSFLKTASGCFNLGNGKGFSVKQVVDMAQKVTGKTIKVVKAERRPGDPALLIADATKAKTSLDWKPNYGDLESIVSSAWEWRKKVHG